MTPEPPPVLGQSLQELWQAFGIVVVTGLAIVTRLLISPVQSWRASLAVVASGVLVAVVGTGPLVSYLDFEGQNSQFAVAAVLGITGETLVRHLLSIVNDPSKVKELWIWWRGGTK